ncbi:MAG: hypothetical protein K0S08_1050 [Gammaproteobacteria bacterium]|jgi:hypothetical protein|nr:hypothetical protein [Gammaproteobacteria bacterium]
MKRNILVSLIASLSMAFAYADSPSPAGQSATSYHGYSLPLPTDGQVVNALPYGVVTAQDLYPLMTGYSLTLPIGPNAGETPFMVQSTPATVYRPNIVGSQPTFLTLGTMLTTIPESKITSFYQGYPDNTFVDLSDLNKLQPSINNQLTFANTPSQNANVYTIDKVFAAPYNAASLFNYLKPDANSPFKNYLAYQQNPAQVYISLVSGALTPAPTPDATDDAYLAQVRRIAAAQTAGVYALQKIFERSKPIDQNDAIMQQLGKNMPASATPQSPREIEKFMATRRLDPQSGWYQHLQQASPVELQREQLYLQAEMLYELHQIHETEERNQLLLAINLLTQNYTNRLNLNTQQKIAAQVNPSASSAPKH